MKYEKALGKVVEFDNTDIMTTSGWDSSACKAIGLGAKICIGGPGRWLNDEEGVPIESEFEVPGDTVIENPVETPVVVEEPTIIEE